MCAKGRQPVDASCELLGIEEPEHKSAARWFITRCRDRASCARRSGIKVARFPGFPAGLSPLDERVGKFAALSKRSA